MSHGLSRCALFSIANLLLLACSGCGGSGEASNQTNLKYTVSTTKSVFASAEPVPLIFTVNNQGQQSVTVSRSACKFFDTKIISNNTVVWQESLTGGCSGESEAVTIAPGQSVSYSYSWNQTDQSGVQVPAGLYSVKSWFEGVNNVDALLSPGQQEANEVAPLVQVSIQ